MALKLITILFVKSLVFFIRVSNIFSKMCTTLQRQALFDENMSLIFIPYAHEALAMHLF